MKSKVDIMKGIDSSPRNVIALTDKINAKELTRRTGIDVATRGTHDDITYVPKSILSLLEKVYKPEVTRAGGLYSVLSGRTIGSPGEN